MEKGLLAYYTPMRTEVEIYFLNFFISLFFNFSTSEKLNNV